MHTLYITAAVFYTLATSLAATDETPWSPPSPVDLDKRSSNPPTTSSVTPPTRVTPSLNPGVAQGANSPRASSSSKGPQIEWKAPPPKISSNLSKSRTPSINLSSSTRPSTTPTSSTRPSSTLSSSLPPPTKPSSIPKLNTLDSAIQGIALAEGNNVKAQPGRSISADVLLPNTSSADMIPQVRPVAPITPIILSSQTHLSSVPPIQEIVAPSPALKVLLVGQNELFEVKASKLASDNQRQRGFRTLKDESESRDSLKIATLQNPQAQPLAQQLVENRIAPTMPSNPWLKGEESFGLESLTAPPTLAPTGEPQVPTPKQPDAPQNAQAGEKSKLADKPRRVRDAKMSNWNILSESPIVDPTGVPQVPTPKQPDAPQNAQAGEKDELAGKPSRLRAAKMPNWNTVSESPIVDPTGVPQVPTPKPAEVEQKVQAAENHDAPTRSSPEVLKPDSVDLSDEAQVTGLKAAELKQQDEEIVPDSHTKNAKTLPNDDDVHNRPQRSAKINPVWASPLRNAKTIKGDPVWVSPLRNAKTLKPEPVIATDAPEVTGIMPIAQQRIQLDGGSLASSGGSGQGSTPKVGDDLANKGSSGTSTDGKIDANGQSNDQHASPQKVAGSSAADSTELGNTSKLTGVKLDDDSDGKPAPDPVHDKPTSLLSSVHFFDQKPPPSPAPNVATDADPKSDADVSDPPKDNVSPIPLEPQAPVTDTPATDDSKPASDPVPLVVIHSSSVSSAEPSNLANESQQQPQQQHQQVDSPNKIDEIHVPVETKVHSIGNHVGLLEDPSDDDDTNHPASVLHSPLVTSVPKLQDDSQADNSQPEKLAVSPLIKSHLSPNVDLLPEVNDDHKTPLLSHDPLLSSITGPLANGSEDEDTKHNGLESNPTAPESPVKSDPSVTPNPLHAALSNPSEPLHDVADSKSVDSASEPSSQPPALPVTPLINEEAAKSPPSSTPPDEVVSDKSPPPTTDDKIPSSSDDNGTITGGLSALKVPEKANSDDSQSPPGDAADPQSSPSASYSEPLRSSSEPQPKLETGSDESTSNSHTSGDESTSNSNTSSDESSHPKTSLQLHDNTETGEDEHGKPESPANDSSSSLPGLWLPTKIEPAPSVQDTGNNEPAAIPSDYPRAVIPDTAIPKKIENSGVMYVPFKDGLRYPYVVQNSQLSAQIFAFLPDVLTYAITSDLHFASLSRDDVSSKIDVERLIPVDSPNKAYVATVAKVLAAENILGALKVALQDPTSHLYQNPNAGPKALADNIDPTFVVGPDNIIKLGEGSHLDALNGYDAKGRGSLDEPQHREDETHREKKSTITVVLTASGGSILYLGFMVFLFRYIKNKSKALGVLALSDTESGFSSDLQYQSSSLAPMGALLLQCESGVSSTIVISAPFEATNSLGWNQH